MRLEGVGSISSAAVRRVGNQAYGLTSATALILASISPIDRRYDAASAPSWARRAMSNTANVNQAWKTPWATSAGWKGASKGNGFFSGSRWDQGRRSPACLAWRTVAKASPPTTRDTSSSPAAIAVAALWTSTWGVVPPIPE